MRRRIRSRILSRTPAKASPTPGKREMSHDHVSQLRSPSTKGYNYLRRLVARVVCLAGTRPSFLIAQFSGETALPRATQRITLRSDAGRPLSSSTFRTTNRTILSTLDECWEISAGDFAIIPKRTTRSFTRWDWFAPRGDAVAEPGE